MTSNSYNTRSKGPAPNVTPNTRSPTITRLTEEELGLGLSLDNDEEDRPTEGSSQLKRWEETFNMRKYANEKKWMEENERRTLKLEKEVSGLGNKLSNVLSTTEKLSDALTTFIQQSASKDDGESRPTNKHSTNRPDGENTRPNKQSFDSNKKVRPTNDNNDGRYVDGDDDDYARMYDTEDIHEIQSQIGKHNRTSKSRKPIMMPSHYNGSEGIDEYLSHFETVASINGWDGGEKCMFLRACLTGAARQLLGLNNGIENSAVGYSTLKTVLLKQYGPDKQTALHRAALSTRKRADTESIADLALSIKQVARRAFTGLDSEWCDRLSIHHFIESLTDTEQRRHVLLANPTSLDDAATKAQEFESICRLERKKENEHNRPYNNVSRVDNYDVACDRVATIKEVSRVESQIAKLSNKFDKLEKRNSKDEDTPSQTPTASSLDAVMNSLLDIQKEISDMKSSGWRSRPNYRRDNYNDGQHQQSQQQRDGCWICGALDHIRRYCPKNWRNRQSGNEEQREQTGLARAPREFAQTPQQ